MPQLGRGHKMPDKVAMKIARRVRAGQSIADAAREFDYTDRTVHRYGVANPEYRDLLRECARVRDARRFRIRHGTTNGYERGCRRKCCRLAHNARCRDYQVKRRAAAKAPSMKVVAAR